MVMKKKLRAFAVLLTFMMLVSGVSTDTQAKTNQKEIEKSDTHTECAYKNKEKIYLDKKW